jgi:hypothetical protein
MEEKEEMDEKLRYIVKRGKNAGIVLTPHLYEDGYFRAYKTNSRNDPTGKEGKRVTKEPDLISLVRSGYHVRMSNPTKGHPPSTVKPEIVIEYKVPGNP